MNYSQLTSPDIGKIAKNAIALVPIAATEQHGPHLPVMTDTALVTEVATRAENLLGGKVVLLPSLWIGCSHHHLSFPGTLSLKSETYIGVLCDLAESLLNTGFRKIVFLNGHGGNICPLSEALYRLKIAHGEGGAWIVGATYWLLGEAPDKTRSFMESAKLTHACEYETSMMLALGVEGIKMEVAQGAQVPSWSRYYDLSGHGPSTLMVSEHFSEITTNGAMGQPEKASAEKGQQLFACYSEILVDFLQEFSQWPERRHPSSVHNP